MNYGLNNFEKCSSVQLEWCNQRWFNQDKKDEIIVYFSYLSIFFQIHDFTQGHLTSKAKGCKSVYLLVFFYQKPIK